MHKTLYIDVDEEITSIIDRVRKSSANEVIIIAPKQALLLQSLVNLKLLKKETDRRKKKLMIVTQDKIGKKLIEKAGILVQGKADNEPESYSEKEEYEEKKSKVGISDEELEKELKPEEELKIGSDQYFDEPLSIPEGKKRSIEFSENIGKITFGELEGKALSGKGAGKVGKKAEKLRKGKGEKDQQVRISDIVASPKSGAKKLSRPKENYPAEVLPKPIPTARVSLRPEKFGRDLQRKTENFFGPSMGGKISQIGTFRRGKGEKIMKTGRVQKKTARYFLVFALTFFILAGFAGAYYFLPKSTIIIYLKNQEKSASAKVEADSDSNFIDKSKNVVPAALEQIIAEKSGEFEGSGRKSGGGKASGNIVIYNEFSSDSQPLVATTRFQTGDGKIFRITKNVVVPGVTLVGTETKPGAIEVEVTADKPGESYNVEPTTFKIPGFEGGPKYNKFYAKSVKAMTGGAEGETPLVTAQDVADAREKLIAEAKKEAAEKLKSSLPQERKFFEDTIATELVEAKPSVSIGAQTDKFSYSVKIKAKVVSFSENDVKEILKNNLVQEGNNENLINFSSPLNYLLSEADSGGKFVKFEAKTDLNLASGIDPGNFKKSALGKNTNELEAFVKTYPSIQKIDVNFWPFFTTRVPMNEKRVKIEVR